MVASTKNSFIVCAYYTKGTPYSDICDEYLRPSLRDLKIDYEIVGVENKGSWQLNTSYKPEFAMSVLESHPKKNIVLLDVDCRVKKYPEIFDHIPEKYNFAAHFLDHDSWYRNNSHRKELLTGTLFLRNNDWTKELVAYWKEACKYSRDWEQKILQNELFCHNEEVYNLPIYYCWIERLPNGEEPYVKCEDPIIIHYQASRKLKSYV